MKGRDMKSVTLTCPRWIRYSFAVLISGVVLFQGGIMNAQQKITLRETIEQLNKHTSLITLGDEKKGFLVLAPDYGARIVAMSANGIDGKNLMWINPKIMEKSFWEGEKRDWNLGGARTWIAPEDEFYLDKDNNWFVPAPMDPGKYKLDKKAKNSLVCSNTFSIKNKSGQSYSVKISRDISLLERSPKAAKLVTGGVKFVGMKFTHSLENLGKETIGKDLPFMGLWSLIQIYPGGTMIIPVKPSADKKSLPYRDYFNPIPPERMSFSDNIVTVKIDGQYRCKYGIAPWGADGHIAFLSKPDKSGEGVLFIKEFTVDPKGKYLDHPWGKPSKYGDAIQMYNDDGKMGGFAEIECHAPAKVLKQNTKNTQTVVLLAYVGKVESLKKIAADILHRDLSKIKLFD